MTRDEWDKACTVRFWYYYQERHLSTAEAQNKAIEWATRAIGPRPVEPKRNVLRPSWPVKVAMSVAMKQEGSVSKVLQAVLRFGPLVAALALGVAAVLEPIIPGYTGIVTQVLSFLGIVGVGPDKELLDMILTFVAGATALLGVARKLFTLAKGKIQPPTV